MLSVIDFGITSQSGTQNQSIIFFRNYAKYNPVGFFWQFPTTPVPCTCIHIIQIISGNLNKNQGIERSWKPQRAVCASFPVSGSLFGVRLWTERQWEAGTGAGTSVSAAWRWECREAGLCPGFCQLHTLPRGRHGPIYIIPISLPCQLFPRTWRSDDQGRHYACWSHRQTRASVKDYVESIRHTVQPGLRKTPHKVTAFVKVNQFS